MTTTNPVPSNDPTDLLFNAQKLDQVVNGSAQSYTDRLGVTRRTMAGIDASADAVLGGLGYAPPVAYAAGIALTLTTQTVEYAGNVYAPKVANLPFTTSGTFETAKFRLIQGVASADLASGGGAAMVGYTPAGTGAASTTVQSKLREMVSVKDFGAIGDFDPTTNIGTDNTSYINAAIKYTANFYQGEWLPGDANYSTSRIISFPSGHYLVNGTIYIPSGITLDLNGATLWGSGITNTSNVMFATGYVNASGNVVSNLATGDENNRVMLSSVCNGSITRCYTALKFKNFNEQCSVYDITFTNCGQAIDAQRCFYAAFHNLTYRGVFGVTDEDARGCFSFTNAANLHTIRKISVGQRKRGFEFAQLSGTIVQECSAEECEVGMWAQANMRAVTFIGCYFEYCSTCNIDLSSASCQEVTVQGCYLPLSPVGIKIGAWTQGRITRDNNFIGTTVAVQQIGNAAYGTVEIPQVTASNNYLPELPSTHQVGGSMDVDFPINVYDASTGNVIFKQKFSPLVNLPFSGSVGIKDGQIPFCTYTFNLISGSNYDVLIDTRIGYSEYAYLIFSLKMNYNGVAATTIGRIIGTNVYYDRQDAGKSITVSNNGGYFRLTVSNYLNPEFMTGIVRHA